jgi:hypothetical protein
MNKINFEEDVANIDQESLESVSSLLQQQLVMENDIEIAELELKDKKDKLRKLSEEVIPARMTELGMSSTTMVDGSKVEGKEAKLLENTIKDLGFIPEVKVSVHPSTLKATVRQLVKDGKSVPDNIFSLFIGQKTKITKKK